MHGRDFAKERSKLFKRILTDTSSGTSIDSLISGDSIPAQSESHLERRDAPPKTLGIDLPNAPRIPPRRSLLGNLSKLTKNESFPSERNRGRYETELDGACSRERLIDPETSGVSETALMAAQNKSVEEVTVAPKAGKDSLELQPSTIALTNRKPLSSISSVSALDDGYVSSSSSPYSAAGRLAANPAPKPKSPTKRATSLLLNYTAIKKDMEVHVDPSTNKTSHVLTTSSSKASLGSSPGDLGDDLFDSPPTSSPPFNQTVQAFELKYPLGECDSAAVLDTQSHDDKNNPDGRETWTSNADFLLSIIGFAVDLANVWRFPYLCYKNGGGAFLIPYTLMLIFGAVPLFYMELILGQYNRQGPISVWKICPLFKGVGFCAVMVAFYVSFYYNVIIAWALYFLLSSFQNELPWMHCNNTWNTDKCWETWQPNTSNLMVTGNATTMHQHVKVVDFAEMNRYTPASEYFHRAVLEMQFSNGLHEIGYPKWQLVGCLMTVYSMLYISLFKGVKSSGKVVWATATMPYVVLTILLIRGLMLPGALTGIKYYLQPELSRLKDTQVWVDAAVQIFYSVGAGFGVHLSYASYNTFHNNCRRDCMVTTAVNCFTSFFSGFVIFTYLGFMSHKQNVHISTVAAEGPGLVFQVYPEAVATLPGSQFWAMLFFFMLIMLGLDSAMGGLECVITGLLDEFRSFFKNLKYPRETFTAIVILLSFTVATINVTPGGIYIFNLLDTYAAGISLLCSALFEAVAVSWFYGLDRFSQDVQEMIGIKPGIYWRVCWKFISPCFIIGVVIFGLIYHQNLQYNDYAYPDWAEWVGWGLALSSILMIPLVAIISLLKTPGTLKERIAINITPVEEHAHIIETKDVSRFRYRHWVYV